MIVLRVKSVEELCRTMSHIKVALSTVLYMNFHVFLETNDIAILEIALHALLLLTFGSWRAKLQYPYCVSAFCRSWFSIYLQYLCGSSMH